MVQRPQAALRGHEVKDEEIAEEDGGGELAGVLPARSWKKIYPVAED
ncbi:hypothetical protein [Pseudonocardia sp. Ae717_Ps2]|nr:hypothetical protein [Pseudonocardia sp. Ae717_Ps2]